MSRISDEYRCECGWGDIKINRRDSRPDSVECPECGQQAAKVFGCAFMTAAYPDGTRRFASIREQRVLEKAKRKAWKSRDKAEGAKVASEIKKLNS